MMGTATRERKLSVLRMIIRFDSTKYYIMHMDIQKTPRRLRLYQSPGSSVIFLAAKLSFAGSTWNVPQNEGFGGDENEYEF